MIVAFYKKYHELLNWNTNDSWKNLNFKDIGNLTEK